MATWFGLADCNNFYASCERICQPALDNKPIVVLSNNDGCVIARSNEAKALGVAMGTPYFKIKTLVGRHGMHVFSSNYALYGDMSRRVMEVLKELAPKVEVYSIDEAFLDLSIFPREELDALAWRLKRTVKRWTYIPISVGIAPTKTLAKLANKWAKKHAEPEGVFVLDEANREEILRQFPLEDVWGIGRKHRARLAGMGITTAWQFTELPEHWVQKQMTVVGLRLWHELRGFSCIPMLEERRTQQAVACTRNFGKVQTEQDALGEALSTFANKIGEKLRRQRCRAGRITVFIHTSPFDDKLPYFSASRTLRLPVATNSSLELIAYALKALAGIFEEGPLYKKVGVIATRIVPDNPVQGNLFDQPDFKQEASVAKTMDTINRRYRKGMVKVACQGVGTGSWQTLHRMGSRRYTTRWEDVMGVGAK